MGNASDSDVARMVQVVSKSRVIRGGVRVTASPGTAVLVVNRSKGFVMVRGARYEPAEVCLSMIAGPDGVAEGLPDDLPYGTYETLAVGAPPMPFQIREEGTMVEVGIGGIGR